MEEDFDTKLKIVFDYARNIQGKKFGIDEDGGKDNMAMAMLFELEFRKFRLFIESAGESLNEYETDKAINKLNILIKLYNNDAEYWDLFWQNKTDINLEKIPFVADNQEQIKYLNLNEIKSITIPLMVKP